MITVGMIIGDVKEKKGALPKTVTKFEPALTNAYLQVTASSKNSLDSVDILQLVLS